MTQTFSRTWATFSNVSISYMPVLFHVMMYTTISNSIGSQLFWYFTRRLSRQIGTIKEMSKKQQIAEIHQKRPVYIHISCFNFSITIPIRIGRHLIVNIHIDCNSNKHLSQLQECYEHIHPHWRSITARCTNSIVGVHYSMNKVIHDDKPLCCMYLSTVQQW